MLTKKRVFVLMGCFLCKREGLVTETNLVKGFEKRTLKKIVNDKQGSVGLHASCSTDGVRAGAAGHGTRRCDLSS